MWQGEKHISHVLKGHVERSGDTPRQSKIIHHDGKYNYFSFAYEIPIKIDANTPAICQFHLYGKK